MTFTNEMKPPLEEALEHYGVPGMKWGVRKDRNSGGRVRGAVKKSAKQQVDFYKPAGRAAKKAGSATRRAATKSAKQQVDFYKKNETSADIKRARRNVSRAASKVDRAEDRRDDATGKKQRASAEKELRKAVADFQKHPDRSTAAKMTLGEVAVWSILTSPVGGLTLVAVSEARSAAIRKQQRGKG